MDSVAEAEFGEDVFHMVFWLIVFINFAQIYLPLIQWYNNIWIIVQQNI